MTIETVKRTLRNLKTNAGALRVHEEGGDWADFEPDERQRSDHDFDGGWDDWARKLTKEVEAALGKVGIKGAHVEVDEKGFVCIQLR